MTAVLRVKPIHLLLLLLVVLSATARAQSIAWTISARGPVSVVAPQPLGTLRALPLFGDVGVAALPGIAPVNGAPAIGLALYKEGPFGPDLRWQLGVQGVVVQGVPSSVGLYIGIGWRLQ